MKHLLAIAVITAVSLTATLFGIGHGLPSAKRLSTCFGGPETVEAKLPLLRQAMRDGVAERSEFRERDKIENYGELAKLSPYFDSVRSYNPDEFHTFKVLSSMYSRRSLLPGSYAYGNFYFYQMAVPLAAARLTGCIVPREPAHYLVHPEDFAAFYLWARAWTALYALATALLLYFTVAKLGSRFAGMLAALAFAALPLTALVGKAVKPDMPVTFWTTLALFFAAFIPDKRAWWSYLACGAAIGCAAATKYTGVLVAVVPLVVALPALRTDWKKLAACAAVSAAVFLLLTPAVFFDFQLWKTDLAGLGTGVARHLPWYRMLAFGVIDYFAYSGLSIMSIGTVLFSLATVAALFVPGCKPRSYRYGLIAFAVLTFAVTCFGQPHSDSYLLPAVAGACLLIALAAMRIWKLGFRGKLAVLALLAIPLLEFADAMAWDQKAAAERDPRLEAAKWVHENIAPGSSIGMRRYPVAYRSVMLDPEKYDLRNELENGREAALDSGWYIDCSLEWDNRAPGLPGFEPVAIFGPHRDSRINYYFETIDPVITIYRKKAAVEPEFIDCDGIYPQHLQGVARGDNDCLFWSFSNCLVKTDSHGKVIKKIDVHDHLGDVTCDGGMVYGTSSVIRNYEKGAESGKVVAFRQSDLTAVAEYLQSDIGYDGLTASAHGFAVAILPNPPNGQTESIVAEYTPDFKTELRRNIVKTPPTYSGVQNLARHDNGYIASCYGNHFYLLDKDFNVVKKFKLDAAIGVLDGRGDTVWVAEHTLAERPRYSARLKKVKLSELPPE
ncbi:MAG: phospholipid carrier-dependent glycosyltransferase [Victivallaceae bacterium]|nr:phospholipid carrier-dependent glycosyltransferase [Victivallaceae bacterium]